MLTEVIQIRPRYGEVDQMGYVYHANYISYCHQARTELLRKYGINDKILEDNNVILPVISFEIEYFKPAYYDELLSIKVLMREIPKARLNFEFEIHNKNNIRICQAKSTLVFADRISRLPQVVPDFVEKAIRKSFNLIHT